MNQAPICRASVASSGLQPLAVGLSSCVQPKPCACVSYPRAAINAPSNTDGRQTPTSSKTALSSGEPRIALTEITTRHIPSIERLHARYGTAENTTRNPNSGITKMSSRCDRNRHWRSADSIQDTSAINHPAMAATKVSGWYNGTPPNPQQVATVQNAAANHIASRAVLTRSARCSTRHRRSYSCASRSPEYVNFRPHSGHRPSGSPRRS